MIRIGMYSIRIMGPDVDEYDGGPNSLEYTRMENFDKTNQEVIDNIGPALSHAEDAINDALPEGFDCKIEDSR
jgi:hypothetical protein